jgi:hypothetical protein
MALIPAKKQEHLGNYVAGLVFPDNHATIKAQDEAPMKKKIYIDSPQSTCATFPASE